uniref:J domain-containing protein n=1 Tax=Aotus nancymaae TaxID=37293 RepID=A0A2K5EZA1_AOTNA
VVVTKEPLQMDLYAVLGIEEKAADKEVKKTCRQKALSCNPRAAELFHQLSQVWEVLIDAAVRKAKKQAAERIQKLDEKRKKVKLDLEARKRQALSQESEEEEGQLDKQQRLIQEQIRHEHDQGLRAKTGNTEGQGTPKLKLKWKCKEEESKGGYSKDVLLRLLQKYGEVLNLVLSSKKAGTAVEECATVKAAELAVHNEVVLVDNPLKISRLEGQPQGSVGPSHPGLSKGSVLLVMMRMRQAQQDREGQPT